MLERNLHVRRVIVRGVLQRLDLRAARERDELVVRRGRRDLQGLLGDRRVQHDHGTVRVRRGLVPHGLLQRQHVRALRLRVEQLVWHRGRELRGLRVRPGVRQDHGAVRLRRDLVRERLLQRLRVRALFVGVGLDVREGRRGMRVLPERPVRHDVRYLLL